MGIITPQTCIFITRGSMLMHFPPLENTKLFLCPPPSGAYCLRHTLGPAQLRAYWRCIGLTSGTRPSAQRRKYHQSDLTCSKLFKLNQAWFGSARLTSTARNRSKGKPGMAIIALILRLPARYVDSCCSLSRARLCSIVGQQSFAHVAFTMTLLTFQ